MSIYSIWLINWWLRYEILHNIACWSYHRTRRSAPVVVLDRIRGSAVVVRACVIRNKINWHMHGWMDDRWVQPIIIYIDWRAYIKLLVMAVSTTLLAAPALYTTCQALLAEISWNRSWVLIIWCKRKVLLVGFFFLKKRQMNNLSNGKRTIDRWTLSEFAWGKQSGIQWVASVPCACFVFDHTYWCLSIDRSRDVKASSYVIMHVHVQISADIYRPIHLHAAAAWRHEQYLIIHRIPILGVRF